MGSVDVDVHRAGISSKKPDIRRKLSSPLELFELGEELCAVFDVGGDKGLQFLTPVVQPAAEVVPKGGNATQNWPRISGLLVHSDGHTKS